MCLLVFLFLQSLQGSVFTLSNLHGFGDGIKYQHMKSWEGTHATFELQQPRTRAGGGWPGLGERGVVPGIREQTVCITHLREQISQISQCTHVTAR